MAQYWLKREGQTAGPFSNQQLKQMTDAGMIVSADMISTDQINWQVGGQIEGLFQTKTDEGIDMIHFQCQGCGKPIEVGREWAGQKFECSRCGKIGTVSVAGHGVSVASRIIGVLLTCLFFLPWLQIDGCGCKYEASGWQLTVGQMSVVKTDSNGVKVKSITGPRADIVNDAFAARPYLVLALISPLVMMTVGLAFFARRIKPVTNQKVTLIVACVGALIMLSTFNLNIGPDSHRHNISTKRYDMEARGDPEKAILLELAKIDQEYKDAIRKGEAKPSLFKCWQFPVWCSLFLHILVILLNAVSLMAQKYGWRQKVPHIATQSPTCSPSGQNLKPVASAEVNSDREMIRFRCKSCDKPIRVEKKYLGLKCKCPRCGNSCKISNNLCDQVPFYQKQWFFWTMYILLPPVCIAILLFGDVYYQRKGEVKAYRLGTKILVGILTVTAILYRYFFKEYLFGPFVK